MNGNLLLIENSCFVTCQNIFTIVISKLENICYTKNENICHNTKRYGYYFMEWRSDYHISKPHAKIWDKSSHILIWM